MLKAETISVIWNRWSEEQRAFFVKVLCKDDWFHLSDIGWPSDNTHINRDIIINIIHDLGYDGFFNYEKTDATEHYVFEDEFGNEHSKYVDEVASGPALGIFNPDCIKIVGRADASEYRTTGKIKLIPAPTRGKLPVNPGW